MDRKVTAIVQARLTSTRFPGKIFEKIGGKILIQILIDRLKKSKFIDQIILAIPDDKKNRIISNKIKNVKIFYGSEFDVLKRYYEAAKKFSANVIVRICGDCPFVDPKIVDKMLKEYQKNKVDYLSNTIIPTFPDGLDVEIFDFKTLKNIHQIAKKNDHREHVTKFILDKKNFSKKNFLYKNDLSKLRLTIDEKIDLEVLRDVYKKINKKFDFDLKDIHKLFKKNKNIFMKNSTIKRNQGSNLNKGQKLWRRAKTVIPGGNMLLSKRPEMYLPEIWPTYYHKAKGCYIWDLENRKYLDFSLMSVGTNILGYANKKIDDYVIQKIKKSNMSSLNCSEEVQLAEKLIYIHKHFDMVRFAKTGGEANSIAIRIARAASGSDKVAICGYHGWHDWYLAANINSKDKKGVLKDHLLPGLSTNGVPKNLRNTIYPFKYNDFKSLEKICSKNKIGVIKMEVFRNIAPKKNFLKKIRELANRKKIILIFDECTSGFRETNGALHLKYGVKPDMCVLGKALGNGYSITAVLGKKYIMQNAQSTFISSTYWGERSGYAAALKTLDEMNRIKSWKIISANGRYFKNKMKKISRKNKLNLKISGLDACPSFKILSDDWLKYKTLISKKMLEKGILASNTTYLSINHNKKLIDKYMNELNKIFNLIFLCEKNKKNINELLDTPVCHTGFKRLN